MKRRNLANKSIPESPKVINIIVIKKKKRKKEKHYIGINEVILFFI